MASRAALAARRLSASLAGARPVLCGAAEALPAAALPAAAWQRTQRRGVNFWEARCPAAHAHAAACCMTALRWPRLALRCR
jgi:hypothetical protein